MAVDLEADARFGGDGGLIGRVSEQDAGGVAIDLGVLQDAAQALGAVRVAKMDADELQAVEDDFFVVEHADAGGGDGVEILGVVGELFVITGNIESAMRCAKTAQGRGELADVGVRAVIEIAGDEDKVGLQACYAVNDAPRKTGSAHVAEVSVRYQCRYTAAPAGRQIRKFYRHAPHANPHGVDEADEAGEQSDAERDRSDERLRRGKVGQACGAVSDPGGDGGQEEKVKEAEPSGSRCVIETHRQRVRAPGEQRSGDESDGEKSDNQSETGNARSMRAGVKSGPCFKDEP